MLKKMLFHSTTLALFFLTSNVVMGQPKGLEKLLSSSIPALLENSQQIEIKPPDIRQLLAEDNLSENNAAPYRMGVSLPVQVDCHEKSTWQVVPDGRIWILKIRSKGAAALGLYFSKFSLPDGCTVHVFDSARTQILGAFTKKSNPTGGLFATGIVPGEILYLECYCPAQASLPDIDIYEVLYTYRSGGIPHINSTRDFGGSDSCEVNINCEEGQDWQDAKHGILRILVKIGGSSFWCTGSLINNTRNDFTPYIITADHCAKKYGGVYATPSDLQQWVFYFNYESADCSNPTEQPAIQSSVGATKLAAAPGDSGSDFYLAMLNNKIPGRYKPYFNGWDRSGLPVSSGVTIHQPEGDIKKISTFNTLISSGEWGVNPGTHWLVTWSPTINGNGVTEPGSSGSPLFDQSGNILGCLTGGNSSCTNLLDPDYYGKFSYSWESNGSVDSLQLRPWLDPENTGMLDVRGSYDTTLIVANFSADATVIPIGSYINYTDRTAGKHSAWKWGFEGANPETSNQQSPATIYYNRPGTYDVKLIASNEFDADTILKENYVRVTSLVYPNPSLDGKVFIPAGSFSGEKSIRVYNRLGQLVFESILVQTIREITQLDLSSLGGNIFLISISSSGATITEKIILLNKQ
jgi:lysyl endopeptidase